RPARDTPPTTVLPAALALWATLAVPFAILLPALRAPSFTRTPTPLPAVLTMPPPTLATAPIPLAVLLAVLPTFLAALLMPPMTPACAGAVGRIKPAATSGIATANASAAAKIFDCVADFMSRFL